MNGLKLTECPRDAMQGLHQFIPTDVKVKYINLLLKCGFDTIDFGSFVSPKAIPQMRDTADVLTKLNLAGTDTKLLAIVANLRGAKETLQHEAITNIGYPLSVSETFQMRNTNATIADALDQIKVINNLCCQTGKKLRVYLSMGFGNPYGDDWSLELLLRSAKMVLDSGIEDIYIADTIGIATPESITEVFNYVHTELKIELGAHLHASPNHTMAIINAAWQSGCRRFDTAIKGFGGCPMAADELTGNVATEKLLFYLEEKGVDTRIETEKFGEAMTYTNRVFNI